MDKFQAGLIDVQCVKKIKKCIEKHQDDIKRVCINKLIRDDIFPLLDENCTVVYYPSNDISNNGFHTNYITESGTIHFVYINTSQHMEKQIFTAAHELGHIWDIVTQIDSTATYEYTERIINRFASELLMPEQEFTSFIEQEIKVYLKDSKEIEVFDMMYVITAAMNYFFTSYKSIVYRFYELGFLSEDNCRGLWEGRNSYSLEKLLQISKDIASEKGYTRLYKIDNRCSIKGLKELLDKAYLNEQFSKEWLDSFYTKFNLKSKGENSVDDIRSMLEFRGELEDEGNCIN